MSHIFKLDLRLKTNQTRNFTLNLSYNKEKVLFFAYYMIGYYYGNQSKH